MRTATMSSSSSKRPSRQLDAAILHFDCFYASVVEHETPSLKRVPLAIQQKQIVVTCNYEARRRGLHKLQLISEAKKVCPDLVIVLGEDISKFRDQSKDLYAFLRSFSWNSRCERLGFDEVWMDTTDMVDFNVSALNSNDLCNSWFCLSKLDPTVGFSFDANKPAGHVYPPETENETDITSLDPLRLRLILASHLAQYLRTKLESEKGFTATVGISTNKLLSKLVGNLHKPNGQTTLLPPYTAADDQHVDNVTLFIDSHDIGKIPGIGFKMAQKIRAHILQRPPEFDDGLVYGGTKEHVLVSDVRKFARMGSDTLQRVVGGPGMPSDIGFKIWALINGCDDSQVANASDIPRQISLEDSYLRLDNLDAVTKELRMLAKSLLRRIHIDLLDGTDEDTTSHRRWLAHPKTIRLSTRPRPAQDPNGGRNRSFARISKSAPMPNFVFNLKISIDETAERLVSESLLPLFRKLHPEKSGWNLSLVNIAATNMMDAASEKGGVGRDIGRMFRFQDDALNPWKVSEEVPPLEIAQESEALPQETIWPQLPDKTSVGSEDAPTTSQHDDLVLVDHWESEDEEMFDAGAYKCEKCGAMMPAFAIGAHDRWHTQRESSITTPVKKS